ncbi:MAG: hypothetical protein BMS9Abin26_1493 [Gammaproteobacteria bacterium]|nr:MAG: hypothetical protein BMS9Abin26_1493 [Gammaproteobacteria bacterium]
MRTNKAIKPGNRQRRQYGQAMTEFVVVAAFVLVPLFLLIPLLGKYIDIKHQTIQSARYEAWEYTAWNSDNTSDRFMGYTRAIPLKTPADVKNEANNRFYGAPDNPLSSADSAAWSSASMNPLWVDHRNDDILSSLGGGNVTESNTPDVTGIISNMINTFGSVAGFVAGILKAVGVNAGFTQLDATGNFRSTSAARVASVDWVEKGQNLSGATENDLGINSFINGLTFRSQAAVMSEGWSAGGKDHTTYQVRGLVPTAILDIQAISAARDVIAPFLLMPELAGKWLKFGYVAPDAVPATRVIQQGKTDPGTVSCNTTIKSYKYRSPGDANNANVQTFTGIFNPDTAIEVVSRTPLSGSAAKFGTCTSTP